MEYHPTIVEAASWRLAAAVTRRHPDVVLTRTLFHGGLRDLLWLQSSRGLDLRINRSGSIQVLGRHDGIEPALGRFEWTEFLTASDPTEFVDNLEREAGLLPASGGSPSTPALVHSAVSEILGIGILSKPFKVTQGFVDSDGTVLWPDDDGFADWWPEMLAVDPGLADREPSRTRLMNKDDRLLVGLDFWRVERADFQLTFDTVTGSIWAELDEDPNDIDVTSGDVYLDNWVGTITDFAIPEGWRYSGNPDEVEVPEQPLRLLGSLLELGLRRRGP